MVFHLFYAMEQKTNKIGTTYGPDCWDVSRKFHLLCAINWFMFFFLLLKMCTCTPVSELMPFLFTYLFFWSQKVFRNSITGLVTKRKDFLFVESVTVPIAVTYMISIMILEYFHRHLLLLLLLLGLVCNLLALLLLSSSVRRFRQANLIISIWWF